MTPGTTPIHRFNIPTETDSIAALRITYEESGKIVLQKEIGECELGEKQVIAKLSQSDTLKFSSNTIVRIQLKYRTADGIVYISDIIEKPVNVVLEREEI